MSRELEQMASKGLRTIPQMSKDDSGGTEQVGESRATISRAE